MKLKKLFEDSRSETEPLDPARAETRSRYRIDLPSSTEKDRTEQAPEDDDLRLTSTGLLGSIPYMAPEYIRKGKTFGQPPIATEKDPLPPFPYHPKQNAVIDPESQIYYTLKSEGPLHWREVFAKITPYLKKLSDTGRDTPQFDAYGEAVIELLRRKVISKTDDGKYVVH